MTPTTNETQIIASEEVPTITIIREFDAPPAKVFRAFTDRDLYAQWVGPRSTTMKIQTWDCRTGGSWRYRAYQGGEEVASFFGSFHEVRPNTRLVQTFTWEGEPDGVSLETMAFEELPGGRTRSIGLSVVESMEIQRAILASGMDVGVREGYEKLDELLPSLS
jgi:uncharacterized protein YndB with AHSA1/START domain